MPSRRVRRFAALVVGVLLGAAVVGCQASVGVRIEVARDGSGTVAVELRLDAEAGRRLGDAATELRLDDLRGAGWEVSGPAPDRDDVVVRATKPFAEAGDLQPLLEEVGGADGVFRGWTVEVDDGFARTEWRLAGDVHLTGNLDQFGDAELTAALDGLPLGRTPEELAAELGDGGTIPLEVEVRLPAEVDGADGSTRTWTFAVPGDAVDETLAAVASERDTTATTWFLAAGLAVVAAVALIVVNAWRHRVAVGARP